MARRLPVPLLIAVVTAAVFLPSVWFGFLPFDDISILNANPSFAGLSSRDLSWVLRTRVLGHWIPVTWLSYAIDEWLWGRNPVGYHAANVAFHAVNAVLCYLAARRLLSLALPAARAGAVEVGAAVAALAFGVHPLRVESVAWVTERRDMLSGALFFLSLLGYLRAAELEGRPARRWRAVSLATFAASLLAKEITMTFPAILVILDVYPLRRFRWPTTVIEKLPFAGVAAAGAAVSALNIAADIGFTAFGRLGWDGRLALFAYSAVFYPLQTFLPVGLSPLHELPMPVDPLAPRFLASMAAVAAVTSFAVLARRHAPWLGAAWAWSIVTVLPVSGVVHVSTILVADRYSYLSTVGWAVVLGGLVAGVLGARARPAVRAASVAVVVLLLAVWASLARAHLSAWRDPESLWTAAVAADPACAQCRAGLAVALLAAGRLADAEREGTLAVLGRPDRADHHAVLASVLERLGRLDEAARSWGSAARLHPHYEADANRVLGLALARRGRFEEAARALRAARARSPMVPVTPDLVRVLNDLAIERIRGGRLDDAVGALEEALALAPGSAEVRENLDAAMRAAGRR